MAKQIEKVYGEALLELAVEECRTESLLKEVQSLKQTLTENPDFLKLMLHPGISETEKEEVLKNVFEGQISREITGLMLLLLKKEHFGQLSLVLDYFIDEMKKKEKIGVAFVKTALPLSKEQKEKVVNRLLETTSYLSFEMHYDVDETLIGGMIIRIGDRVMDNSIRTKLDNLSRQLYQIKLQ